MRPDQITEEMWLDSVLTGKCPALLNGLGIKLSRDHVFKEGKCVYCGCSDSQRKG